MKVTTTTPITAPTPECPFVGRYRANRSILLLILDHKAAIVLDRGDSGFRAGQLCTDGFFSPVTVEPLPPGTSVTLVN